MNEAVKFVKKLNEMNGGREVTQNDFDSGNVAFMPLAFSEYRTYKTYPYKIKNIQVFSGIAQACRQAQEVIILQK